MPEWNEGTPSRDEVVIVSTNSGRQRLAVWAEGHWWPKKTEVVGWREIGRDDGEIVSAGIEFWALIEVRDELTIRRTEAEMVCAAIKGVALLLSVLGTTPPDAETQKMITSMSLSLTQLAEVVSASLQHRDALGMIQERCEAMLRTIAVEVAPEGLGIN